MNNLIGELKNEHSILLDMLKGVKSIGISQKEGKDKLMKAKNTLLGHLKKEDERLYPVLRANAVKNPDLNSVLTTFAKDMDVVSSEVIGFFKKYEQGGDAFEFAKDFGRINVLLSTRIRKEETILYEEYVKILNK